MNKLFLVLCVLSGTASADVVMQDNSAAQYRNDQWELQQYERRQAEAMEQEARQERQRQWQDGQDRLDQWTPMYPSRYGQ